MQKNRTTSSQIQSFSGDVTVSGDKSISHRALILSSQAIGHSVISGLLEGEDVLNTAKALQACGVNIVKNGDLWHVDGVGVGGLSQPDIPIDCGNSGTGVRLLMGLLASYDFEVTFTGDESLKSRPMGRVIKPLEMMGVSIKSNDNKLPITVQGSNYLTPILYKSPVASAQLKSCILLAGLNIPGVTTVIELEKTRDHTERMLVALGAKVKVEGNSISLTGQPELSASDINVPADPSSAAFLVVAALIIPNSKLTIRNVLINETRIGLFTTLIEMGGKISFTNQRIEAGEEVADIYVESSSLKGVDIPAERAPSMIDEYPILAVAASIADGQTIMNGIAELKVKESNRLAAIIEGLSLSGVEVEAGEDSIKVVGGRVAGGSLINTYMDHRIAMSFLVLGMVSDDKITIDDASMIATSFPSFIELMNDCGARIDNGQ